MLVCNICGGKGERFDDSSRVDDRRAQLVCPSCGSFDCDRAPECCLRRFDFAGMATWALIAGNSDASLPLAGR